MSERHNAELGQLVDELAKLARQQHYYCDDCWYTCPAHPEGTANDFKERGVCDCGANEHNAVVDALRSRIAAALQGHNAKLSRAGGAPNNTAGVNSVGIK